MIVVGFAISGDHKMKIKANENRDNYLDLSRELKKKLWNMKVTVIPIVCIYMCVCVCVCVREREREKERERERERVAGLG